MTLISLPEVRDLAIHFHSLPSSRGASKADRAHRNCNSTCGSASAPAPHTASAHVLISIKCNQTHIKFYVLLVACDLTSYAARGLMVKWSDSQEQLQSCLLSHGVAIPFAGENSVVSDVQYLIGPILFHKYTGNFPLIT